jgi:hypothetical protein
MRVDHFPVLIHLRLLFLIVLHDCCPGGEPLAKDRRVG